MIVRSYTGRTVPEALAKVRNDLGDQALIIETRSVKEPGLLGRKCGYEVVAARDDSEVTPRKRTAITEVAEFSQERAPVATQATALARSDSANSAASTPVPRTAIEDELLAIRKQLARLAAGKVAPTAHLGEELASHLDEVELPAELIAEIDDALARAGERLDANRRREFVALLLARGLAEHRALDWSTCRRLLMVGPTGVGKTTTIAKLASDLVLTQRKRVALVTIDTYRVGATDQLRAYADLLDIPIEIAETPARLGEILRRFEHLDHVLIDTAGRSPADTARVHELKGFCRAAANLDVMLAVAATSGRAEFAAVVERFSVLPIAHTVITKLDECAAPGRLYGCLRRHRLPVNFLTTGQEVPRDIVAADPALVAERVLAPSAAVLC